ncbi:MAG TPA: hydroxyacylglutathione hydrolase, partial [Casimicrobiaceae bacterium]|nr:hydroxyacylglutathione hydrolase [Casimicrobiaceae bacterium]
FRDNYIWLLREGRYAAVVDPGDAAPVLAFLEANALELAAIIATHHHGDHVGGIPELTRRFEVPVFGPAREAIPGRTHALAQDDSIVVPGIGLGLEVIDIPGHTAGHIAYFSAAQEVLFCGDTLFAAGCGRVFEGTPAQMWESLSKLAALPGTTRVYCGHEYTIANLRFAAAVEPGNAELPARTSRAQARRDAGAPTLPSTIAEERATNPFLRAEVPGVVAAAASHAGRSLTRAVDVFAELREWKNGFQ